MASRLAIRTIAATYRVQTGMVADLAAENKVQLTGPLTQLVPDLAGSADPNVQKIRLIDLATNAPAYRARYHTKLVPTTDPFAPITWLKQNKLLFEPGRSVLYSNFGFDLLASASCWSSLAIYRPNPGDDFPDLSVSLDDLAEGRHWPDDIFGALAHKALLLERIAWAETARPKRDQPEQRVVVIAINPNLIGEGRRHSSATTASMAATAVVSQVDFVTFLGDAGEVRVWAFQLTFWRADRALKRRHGLLGRGITPTGQCGYDQTHKNSANCPRHGALARCLSATPDHWGE
jgi:hypothetical protein